EANEWDKDNNPNWILVKSKDKGIRALHHAHRSFLLLRLVDLEKGSHLLFNKSFRKKIEALAADEKILNFLFQKQNLIPAILSRSDIPICKIELSTNAKFHFVGINNPTLRQVEIIKHG